MLMPTICLYASYMRIIIGNVESIDTSLANVWRSWYAFARGKKRTADFDAFAYDLETNLEMLREEISSRTYTHGSYQSFYTSDTKKRHISVASIRDRVAHRLLYDYLVGIFDRTFIY